MFIIFPNIKELEYSLERIVPLETPFSSFGCGQYH